MPWTDTPPDDVTGEFEVEVTARVRITIIDPSVVTRAVENHDDQGVPQPDVKDGTGWRNVLYSDVTTRDRVLAHLAYNAVANGVTNAAALDGWADMPREAATMDVRDVDTRDGDVTLVTAPAGGQQESTWWNFDAGTPDA